MEPENEVQALLSALNISKLKDIVHKYNPIVAQAAEQVREDCYQAELRDLKHKHDNFSRQYQGQTLNVDQLRAMVSQIGSWSWSLRNLVDFEEMQKEMVPPDEPEKVKRQLWGTNDLLNARFEKIEDDSPGLRVRCRQCQETLELDLFDLVSPTNVLKAHTCDINKLWDKVIREGPGLTLAQIEEKYRYSLFASKEKK